MGAPAEGRDGLPQDDARGADGSGGVSRAIRRRSTGIEQVQTHISQLYLTRDRVYKLRKAVVAPLPVVRIA